MSLPFTLDELTACGAHRRGHFRLSSGLHSADYLQCALYLADPTRAARAGTLIAAAVRAAELAPELIVAPALGGVIVGHETARALGLPAVLGSWWSVPIMATIIAITVVRTAREDRYLRARLTGYAAYADRVRWRLVPHIW